MEHPKCETCKHWEPEGNEHFYGARKGKRECTYIIMPNEMEKWDDDFDNVVAPEYADRLATVVDGSSYYAGLLTDPNFYCPMHSELKKEVA